jgi:hypothetical protein
MMMLSTASSGNVNDEDGTSLENNSNNNYSSSCPMSKVTNNKDQDDAHHLYERYMNILNTLPEGWSRNPKAGSVNGEAPFVHASSGKVSWKHPSHVALKEFSFVHEEEQKRQSEDSNMADADVLQYQVRPITSVIASYASSLSSKHEQKIIKMLRLMLQTGAPLEAVERRAAIENIDMSMVLMLQHHHQLQLQPQKQNQQQPENEPDRAETILVANSSFFNHTDNNKNKVVVSPVLLKKYCK